MVVIGLILYTVFKNNYQINNKAKSDSTTLHVSFTANIRDNFVNYKLSFVMCNMRFKNLFKNTFFTYVIFLSFNILIMNQFHNSTNK